ncbi:SAM-dependent methyltransferase [Vibrio parahaemolyticus]|nr:SAM-dependent methyltransferase [Vibrio parahaemolyticus]MCS0033246.1 SAM-dependent methyltransferase [Vibrio parahaemolyticus]
MPSGVFKPYAGVSTAILIFTKGGSTDKVWFYDVKADGFSLDDKRTAIKDNDLPDLVKQYRSYQQAVISNSSLDGWQDKTQKAFIVDKAAITAQKYDLSINRYKEVVYEQETYEEPKVILGKLKALENEILADLNELESML